MRILVVAPRFPWPPYTGDRLRATLWIAALSAQGTVHLVSPAGTLPAHVVVRFAPARWSVARFLRALLNIALLRLPLQTALTAPYRWEEAIRTASREGAFDLQIVILSRTHPWVRASLHAPLRILDAVDSLTRSALERAGAASSIRRWFWRREASRLAVLERSAASAYERVVVVSEDERDDFGRSASVVGVGVPILPLHAAVQRPWDFGFWGRLAYFANEDAARWMLEEIWPALRAAHPGAKLIIGGADAPAALRRLAAARDVTLVSPVPSISEFARSIRVAVIPLRYGTGQSSKVLEAAEAGCAIVATSRALRGFPRLAAESIRAESSAEIAAAAARLAADHEALERCATALRETVVRHHSRHETLAQLSALAGVRS